MTGTSTRPAALPIAVCLLAMPLLAGTARAQDRGAVQDFQLPSSAPTPKAAGPIDDDHPTAAPTRPAETPPTVSLPPPPPVVVLPTPAEEAPPSRRSAPAAQEARPAAPAPQASSPAADLAAPPTPSLPTTAAAAPAESPPVPASTAPAPEPSAMPWSWIAGGLAAVLALIGGLIALRRRAAAPLHEEPAEPAAEPQPGTPVTLRPPRDLSRADPPAPAPKPPAPPPPALREPRPLEMQLEARHLSRAMVNASLAYRLTLTNGSDAPTGALRISGDIVSAHASLSAQEQLDPDTMLAALHEVPGLAPGESVTLSGELRLPIASILPIHSGRARVFVPLARFRAESAEGPATTRVFVIGQESGVARGTLRPFPLDRGPGVDRGLGQRELELPL